MGGMLGYDGRAPEELCQVGRAELVRYPTVVHRSGTVVRGSAGNGAFELELDDGSSEIAHTVLLAAGTDYRPPNLPGVPERWGRSVFHCPFCHGWEVRDKRLGVLDPGPRSPERALLLRLWSDDVTLFTNGNSDLGTDGADRLAQANVTVEGRVVVELRGSGDSLEAVAFADGSERACEGLLVVAPMHERSTLASQLGARVAESGSPIEAVEVDAMCRTSVAGLYAAGDISAMSPPSVATAIAAGSTAAKTIVHDLVEELYSAPVDDP
jgi:thioredoxin reductase